jgi:hypothetical protein
MMFLNNGLQYSIEKPPDKYWTELIMETEQAIRKLDIKMQALFRILATKKIRQISASSSHYNMAAKRQTHILETINSKLVKENAIVVKADKGKTCVIIHTDDHNEKVHNFLNNNNFQKPRKDPTNKCHKLIIKTLQQCDMIVHKNHVKHLIQKKPHPPTLKAQIKIHKPGNPIRPIVDNTAAPTYKISIFLANK